MSVRHARATLLAVVLTGCAPAGSPTDDDSVDDEAFAFLPDAGPRFVEDDALGADGLILDRLDVLLANGTGQAALDAALDAVGGSIAASRPGLPWITVTVPPMADLDEVRDVAARLAEQPGIVFAGPSWLVSPPAAPVVTDPPQAAPPGFGGSSTPHLGLQRFYAAWNVAPLARERVEAWVVDTFTSATPPEQLGQLRFVGPEPGLQVRDENGEYPGNHGFWVASLLGADVDDKAPAGTHANPERTLDLVGVNYQRAGSDLDLVLLMDRHLPTDRFAVVNTSFGFGEGVEPEEKALVALAWREVLLRRRVELFHATSAGNEGWPDAIEIRYNSMFTAQSAVDDLGRLLTSSNRATFDRAWAEAIERHGLRVQGQVGRTVIVGASTVLGTESKFSNRGSDVRMIGEALTGACGRPDATCQDGALGRLMTTNGTSGSSPQVAGLAAWLRAIDPTLTAAELVDLVLAHGTGGWVDALGATLALEARGVPVRRAWLDHDGDGGFDEEDVTSLLVELVEGDSAAADAPRTWPRADLNGDGRARSDTTASVDLDGDGALGAVGVEVPGDEAGATETLTLDEARLSDRDILCWGAYGAIFDGDDAERDTLLRPVCVRRGARGTVTRVRREVCPHGERTTTITATVELNEAGALVAVSGQGTDEGQFSNVTPGDCVAHLDYEGPLALSGDGSTSTNQIAPGGDSGSLSLVWMRGGQTSYTGLDDCPEPLVDEVEANIVDLAWVRTEAGVYDFARELEIPGDCTTTTTVEGELR